MREINNEIGCVMNRVVNKITERNMIYFYCAFPETNIKDHMIYEVESACARKCQNKVTDKK